MDYGDEHFRVLVGKVRASGKIDSIINARQDVWAEEVLARPEGPTYENIKDYLPPLGAVKASFKYYPLVLSLPGSPKKFQYISNGGEVHVSPNPWRREGIRWDTWYLPDLKMSVLVGADREQFGADFARLNGPAYMEGYLPIIRISYEHAGVLYHQEVFSAPAIGHAELLSCYIRITAESLGAREAEVALKFECDTPLKIRNFGNRDMITLHGVETACQFSHPAEFDEQTATLIYRWDLSDGAKCAYLMLPMEPITPNHPEPLTTDAYERVKRDIIAYWKGILGEGVDLHIPEEIVNNAWRALVIQNLTLINRDSLHYSYGNTYDRTYAVETLDTVISLVQSGYYQRTKPLIEDINDYKQTGLEYHSTAGLINGYFQHYMLYRDDQFIRKNLAYIIDGCERIIHDRSKTDNGLLPPADFCGDIPGQKIYAISVNALSWRALRDSGHLLKMLGMDQLGQKYLDEAASYRQAIRKAVEASAIKVGNLTFIPLRLYDKSVKPLEHIVATVYGSYYNLLMPYVLSSEVFAPNDPITDSIMQYLENKGGRLLGLVRFEDGIDALYGLGYNIALLKRNEIDKFLVAFYAMLAHGFTRDTFVGGEVTSLYTFEDCPYELRRMGNPPNSTSNALFLQSLRYMLVLENDSQHDGVYDELHLLRGTPRAWLEDGKIIRLRNVPTYFGPVSLEVHSRISEGQIEANIRCPDRNPPDRITLTLRLPSGYMLESVEANGKPLEDFDADTGLVRLGVSTGSVEIRAKCRR